MVALSYEPGVDLFGNPDKRLTRFSIKLMSDDLRREYRRLEVSKLLSNDWTLWSEEDVKAIKPEFENIHPMFHTVKAYELAIRFKRTLGAIGRQKQHVFSNDPTLHRNQFAKEIANV